MGGKYIMNKVKRRETDNTPDIINILRVVATMFVFLLHGRSYIEHINATSTPLLFLTYTPAWAGVWIFLYLSSFLIGLGFFKGRYSLYRDGKLSPKALMRFYWGRFLRIAPPYYIYCLLVELFNGDHFFYSNPVIFFRFFFFMFDGNGGCSGTGHLWYLSLAMQLYLIMPFFYLLIQKISSLKCAKNLFWAGSVSGLILRLFLRHIGVDWYRCVYTFAPANLDFVFCGMITAYLQNNTKLRNEDVKMQKVITCGGFLGLVVYNCYLYCYSSTVHYDIYRYVLPTCYILVCTLLILLFHNFKNRKPLSREAIMKNPLRIVDLFSKYTYVFYIFHVSIFSYVRSVLVENEYYINLPLGGKYIAFMMICFFFCLLISIIFTKMTESLHIKQMWK